MVQVRAFVESAPGDGDEPPAHDWAPTYTLFVCRIGLAIARALTAVHRTGLVHRDVKPSNILLRRDGTPLLTDFGLARDADSTLATQAGQFLGTPAYAPPEQLRADQTVLDPRADVYSLGAALFHALSLRLPYDGSGTAEILRQVEGGRLTPLRKLNPRVPRDLETIIAKAMDPAPAGRYQTADELAEDLARLLALRPIHARHAGPMGRAVKAMRRNRTILIGGIAGAIAAAILAAALVVYVFLVPPWIERHVAAARSALINPRYAELFYTYKAKVPDPNILANQCAGAIDRCDAALREYDVALMALGGRAARSSILLERDTVAMSRTILSGKGPGVGVAGSLLQSAPGTARVTRKWLDAAVHEPFDSSALDGLSPTDLRCLGLLAYLCLDVDGSVEAWSHSGFDLGDPPDSLILAAAGQNFLVEGSPAVALIRLDRAHALLPTCKKVTIALVDAAVRCGDLRLGEQMIRAAGECDQSDDPFEVLLRTRAMLLAKRDRAGDFDEACRLYEQYIARHTASAAYVQYAQLLTSHREAPKAMEVYHRLARARSADPVSLGQFVRGIRRAWGALDQPGRERLTHGDATYAAIWDLYDRTVRAYTPEQLRDPSDSPSETHAPEATPLPPRP